jgi:hypothetical protein
MILTVATFDESGPELDEGIRHVREEGSQRLALPRDWRRATGSSIAIVAVACLSWSGAMATLFRPQCPL